MPSQPHLHKALFLDRDGVINEDTGYPHRPEHIVFRPGIFEFCRAVVAKGYVIVVVTNQAGVAKGKFTEADVRALHTWMGEVFLREGVAIAGFYYCPFHAEAVLPEYRQDSAMRKPRPGMVLQAAEELGIDIGRSLMVGDKPSDRIDLPELRSVIVRSSYASKGYDVEQLRDVERYLE